jgi:HEPN domain-containing protein
MPEIHITTPELTKRRLFDAKAASVTVFFINGSRHDWTVFAMGYKHAADGLVQGVLARNGPITEAACLPALFLYRQFVELSLKGMLRDAGELLYLNDQPPGIHGLVELWLRLRKRIDEIERVESDEWMNRAEELIREFDALDSSSFTFRYPADKKGVVKLPKFKVDIRHFRSVMNELDMVLGGIADWLSNYVDIQHDMEHDFGYEY